MTRDPIAALRPFQFAGLSFAGLDSAGAAQWIADRSGRGEPAVVVTPNINHLQLAQASPEALDA